MKLLCIIFTSSLISWALIFLQIKKFRNLIIDIPNSRSSHSSPTPSVGGLGFVISGIFAPFFLNTFTGLFFLPIVFISFLDDLFKVKSIYRYLIHVLTACFLLFYSNFYINFIDKLTENFFSIIIIIFLVIGITATINFVNFMDGLDGLVGGCMLVGIAYKFDSNPSLSLSVLSALIVFLIFNWHPSKIFMGDVGSTFLAVVFLSLVLTSHELDELFGTFLIIAPIIFDAFFCVLRRLYYRQNIFKAHKSHLYQRLNQAGWSHNKVSILYIMCTIFCAVSYNIFGILGTFLSSIFIFLLGIWLDNKKAKTFIF